MLAMVKALNEEGTYKALYVNIEAAQAARNDAEGGLAVICETLAASARIQGVQPELEQITRDLAGASAGPWRADHAAGAVGATGVINRLC
ncbi:MAG: hypothetical protein R3E89_10310 [Thiolinea sp.]